MQRVLQPLHNVEVAEGSYMPYSGGLNPAQTIQPIHCELLA